MLVKKKPSLTTPKRNAAKSVPTGEPKPPLSVTPPITQAVTTSNTRSCPLVAFAWFTTNMLQHAVTMHESEQNMNSMVFSLATGTPHLTAGVRISASCVDSVPQARGIQDPGSHDRDPDPPVRRNWQSEQGSTKEMIDPLALNGLLYVPYCGIPYDSNTESLCSPEKHKH